MERSLHCWKCQTPLSGVLFCDSCNAVQPTRLDLTHFQVLGLQPAVQVDSSEMEKTFRSLSLKVHPDRVAKIADAKERRFATEQSAKLNEAYKTLKSPSKRAFYLLALQGVDLLKDDGRTLANTPPELLEDVIEKREALAEAKEAQDLDAAQALGEKVEKELKEALAAANQQLELLIEKSSESETAHLKQEAAVQLSKVRYLERFLEEVESMEEELLG